MLPPTIVVVGSLHYDIMVDAPHRPRKGETVTGSRLAARSSAARAAIRPLAAVARRRADVRMAGAVGDDEFGQLPPRPIWTPAGWTAPHVAVIAARHRAPA